MSKLLKSTISYLIIAALTLSVFAATVFAENGDSTEEEPTTVICTSDLLVSANSLSQAAQKRLELYKFCRDLASEGKADAMIIGGDVTAETMTESTWNYCAKQLSEVLSEASDTVLYITGNTDYYAGEDGGYNSADYIGTSMADRLGELYYWDVYYGTVDGVQIPLAYRYYVSGVYFYFLNTAPNDMKGALRYGNFVYSQDAVSWLEKKMQVDDPNGDALMFFAAHFPLEGTGSENGAMEQSVSERLTDICSQHVNLIYLYSNSSAALADTSEKVLNYNTEGLVLTGSVQEGINLSSLWTFIPHSDGTYSVKNCFHGKYLAVEEGYKLRMSDDVVSWKVNVANGRIQLLASDGVNGVKVPKSGRVSFSLGEATPLELYVRSADSKGTIYTYADAISPGEDYVIVSDSRYVLSAAVAGNGLRANEARVMGDLLVESERRTSSEGDPGFTSVYMGTASTANGNLQYLDIGIYGDRVELTLKDYTADGETTSLITYVRPLATKKVDEGNAPSSKAPSSGDVFDVKLYLIILASAAAVGCVISASVSLGIRRKRFFE